MNFDALTRHNLCSFACDCAERALPTYEEQHPDDSRPRDVIEMTRRCLVDDSAYQSDIVQDALDAVAQSHGSARYAAQAAAGTPGVRWEHDLPREPSAARDVTLAAWDAVDGESDGEGLWQLERFWYYLESQAHGS
jgi:hypothetical protein